MNPVASTELLETLSDLKNAQKNLKRINKQFSEEPELLGIYSYSAKELIKKLENHLEYLLNNQTDSKFTLTSSADDIDVWVHIEGDKFKEGRGPINLVGSYLKKLNNATQHTISVLKERKENFITDVNFEAYFELAEISKGSLKLGLKSKVNSFINNDQGTLFDDDSDDKASLLEDFSRMRKLSSNGLALLLQTLSSADDDQAIKDIFDEYGADDAMKLLHFAKELAPSSRSNISQISFEGRLLPKNKPFVRTNRDTRRNLISKSKSLIQNKEFVQGTALIEQYKNNINDDYYSLFARPLKINKKILNIELKLNKDKHQINEGEVLNEFLDIEGFLHFNTRSNPTYVVVDKIIFDKDNDIDFSDED